MEDHTQGENRDHEYRRLTLGQDDSDSGYDDHDRDSNATPVLPAAQAQPMTANTAARRAAANTVPQNAAQRYIDDVRPFYFNERNVELKEQFDNLLPEQRIALEAFSEDKSEPIIEYTGQGVDANNVTIANFPHVSLQT